MADLSAYSDWVALAANLVQVGDLLEHEEVMEADGVYLGRCIVSGAVASRSSTVGLDGKLRFDVAADTGEMFVLRLGPNATVRVRRRDS